MTVVTLQSDPSPRESSGGLGDDNLYPEPEKTIPRRVCDPSPPKNSGGRAGGELQEEEEG